MKSKLILISLSILIFSCKQGKENEKAVEKNNCVISTLSENSQMYKEEEAVCFIVSLLADDSVTKDKVKIILEHEFEYMDKLGLVSDSQPSVSPEPVVIDMDKLTESIFNAKVLDLSRDQIRMVLDSETDYLKFIGLAE